MAYGISVQLPLSLDVNDGAYTLNKDIKQSVKQNFKNLILTAPGERIMDPASGVGIRNYLFENSDDFTSDDIKSKINEQVGIYLPFITILEIRIANAQNVAPLSDLGRNEIHVSIVYHIKQINASDTLDIKF